MHFYYNNQWNLKIEELTTAPYHDWNTAWKLWCDAQKTFEQIKLHQKQRGKNKLSPLAQLLWGPTPEQFEAFCLRMIHRFDEQILPANTVCGRLLKNNQSAAQASLRAALWQAYFESPYSQRKGETSDNRFQRCYFYTVLKAAPKNHALYNHFAEYITSSPERFGIFDDHIAHLPDSPKSTPADWSAIATPILAHALYRRRQIPAKDAPLYDGTLQKLGGLLEFAQIKSANTFSVANPHLEGDFLDWDRDLGAHISNMELGEFYQQRTQAIEEAHPSAWKNYRAMLPKQTLSLALLNQAIDAHRFTQDPKALERFKAVLVSSTTQAEVRSARCLPLRAHPAALKQTLCNTVCAIENSWRLEEPRNELLCFIANRVHSGQSAIGHYQLGKLTPECLSPVLAKAFRSQLERPYRRVMGL